MPICFWFCYGEYEFAYGFRALESGFLKEILDLNKESGLRSAPQGVPLWEALRIVILKDIIHFGM